MGAKTWMMIWSDTEPKNILGSYPEPDPQLTHGLINRAFKKHDYIFSGNKTLYDTCPNGEDVVAACYPGLSLMAFGGFGLDKPSTLDRRFVNLVQAPNAYLFAMHSVVDWFAFAHWSEGKLSRSMSVSPDSGVMEDLGEKFEFERPFWIGEHPAIDPEEIDDGNQLYPLPFHPLEFGEAAFANLLGFVFEGIQTAAMLEPASVKLMGFSRKRKFFGLF